MSAASRNRHRTQRREQEAPLCGLSPGIQPSLKPLDSPVSELINCAFCWSLKSSCSYDKKNLRRASATLLKQSSQKTKLQCILVMDKELTRVNIHFIFKINANHGSSKITGNSYSFLLTYMEQDYDLQRNKGENVPTISIRERGAGGRRAWWSRNCLHLGRQQLGKVQAIWYNTLYR